MDATSAGPLVAFAITTGVQLVGAAIVFGGLMNRVKDLERRCALTDRELEGLRGLGAKIAKVEGTLESLVEQLRDLNYSIAWMRQPAAWGEKPPLRRQGES